MHDTLEYLARNPVHRRFHHDQLTFRSVYAFSENFVLPLSHDEVVHGKGSLLAKMPGDDWQRFANLRLLYCYQFALPGKKLLFMGDELAPWQEWDHETGLDWNLAGSPPHAGDPRTRGRPQPPVPLHAGLLRARARPARVRVDAAERRRVGAAEFRASPRGRDAGARCLQLHPGRPGQRAGRGTSPRILGRAAEQRRAPSTAGSGVGNLGGVESHPLPNHAMPHSLTLTVPPLGCLVLEPQ